MIDRQAAFHDLLQRHRGIVFKVVHAYCWHPDDREELSQEIVGQLWRSFRRYDPARPFATWMYRVALNVAISFVRGHQLRRRHLVPLDPEHHDRADPRAAEPDDRRAFLRRFLTTLDPLHRALLVLYLEERSYREIADVLGISETNVATKISRLKQRVREASAAGRPGDRPHRSTASLDPRRP